MPTPTQQLIEVRLGRDLGGYVKERRQAGDGWRRIADHLHARTGIAVSYESLRRWCPERRDLA